MLSICIWYVFLSSFSQKTSPKPPEASHFRLEGDKCSPIHRNANIYAVSIDGQRYPQSVPAHLNSSLNFECLNRGPLKRILLWNKFWWSNDFDFGLGVRTPFSDHKCPVTNCEVTNDRSKYNCSDLVLFHAFNLINRDKVNSKTMPDYRAFDQRWVVHMFCLLLLFNIRCVNVTLQ